MDPSRVEADPSASAQRGQQEWHYQWSRFRDDAEFLFREWIAPNTLESFEGLTVMEAGCGPGHHTRLVAPHSVHVTAVDLNTAIGNVLFALAATADAGRGERLLQAFDIRRFIGLCGRASRRHDAQSLANQTLPMPS